MVIFIISHRQKIINLQLIYIAFKYYLLLD